MRRGRKMGFMMPKLHDRFDHPFRLAIGLGIPDLRKPMFYPVIVA